MTYYPKAKRHEETVSEKVHRAYMHGLILGRAGKDPEQWNPYIPFGPFRPLHLACALGFQHAKTF